MILNCIGKLEVRYKVLQSLFTRQKLKPPVFMHLCISIPHWEKWKTKIESPSVSLFGPKYLSTRCSFLECMILWHLCRFLSILSLIHSLHHNRFDGSAERNSWKGGSETAGRSKSLCTLVFALCITDLIGVSLWTLFMELFVHFQNFYQVASMASLLRQQRVAMDKRIMKISEVGVSVWSISELQHLVVILLCNILVKHLLKY